MSGRLVVLAPTELGGGFRLAGVAVQTVAGQEAADAALEELLDRGDAGVVAVYEPLLAGAAEAIRHRAERSLDPFVFGLPTGAERGSSAERRSRLLARLERAIGYRVTFGEDQS